MSELGGASLSGPDFLIVGAAKAGTTSLYAWLAQHPEIFVPPMKEPTFFVPRGLRTVGWDTYLSLFAGRDGRSVAGEASTAYLTDPDSPGMIARYLENPRIIILLRDPVRRAFSQYRWMVMHGYEPIRTFRGALAAEDRRWKNHWFRAKNPENFWDFMYFRSGCYAEQIERYFERFGRARTRVCLLSDMAEDPAAFYADICRFLGISADFEPRLEVENEGRFPRSRRAQFLLGQAQRFAVIHSWHRRRVESVTRRLQQWNVRLGSRGRLDPEVERELRARYVPAVRRTAALLERDLSHWLPLGREALDAA